MSLNKPRPDYPIYPSTGYFRERAKAFKRPKGRRGRKPKGQRVGRFVPFQDPNFLIIKAQDEMRKARELAVAQAKEEIEFKKAQRQELEDSRKERAEREETRVAEREEDRADREEERRQMDEDRAQLRIESDRREQRLLEDRKEIAGHLTKLFETQERRAGENIAIFTEAFKAITDRRPVDFEDIKLQEQTDLSADQRRDRRGRSESFDREVSVGLESLAGTPKERQRTPSPERERQVKQVKQQFQPQPKPEPEPESGGGKVNIPIETIEQTTKKGRDVKLPKRFEGGATEEELAAAGGIGGQTPASERYKQTPKAQTTARGGSGTEEVERQRPKKKAVGKIVKKEDPLLKATGAFLQQLDETAKISEELTKKKGGDGK